MNKPSYAEGDLVKVTSGAYANAVGVVDDLQPDCSTVRIHAKEGPVYAFIDAVQKMPQEPKGSTRPLLKK